MGKVYISILAYNAEKTIRRCLDSVVNQTYEGEIEIYVCNNASIDSTGSIIKEYCARDNRIRYFENYQNHVFNLVSQKFGSLTKSINDDDYFCTLDSDDEYSTDFVKEMVMFMTEYNLDVAACGTAMVVGDQIKSVRAVENNLVISYNDLGKYYSIYHQFMRPVWGKLFSGRVAKYIPTVEGVWEKVGMNLGYGGDTLRTFSALKHADRIGILSKVLHKYYIYPKSVSYTYNKGQAVSDVVLYNDAIEYLSAFGEISPKNRLFINLVYSNAIIDTARNLLSSNLSVDEKAAELCKILSHQITKKCLIIQNNSIAENKTLLIKALIEGGSKAESDIPIINEIMSYYYPKCGRIITKENCSLFTADNILLDALLSDNKPSLMKTLTEYISKNKYVKQYDLVGMVKTLYNDDALMQTICDKKFIQKHIDIFMLVGEKKYPDALDKMTEYLLKNNKTSETFIQLYLSLAAGLECADEFIFGKIKLALFYVNEKRFDECRAVLEEISEMGVEDNEDITEIKRKLNS